jgi:hypothetical protein
MQVLLDAEGDGDMDDEEMEDEADFEDEAPMDDAEEDDNAFSDDPAPLDEGVDWRRRAGLLAGITNRY